MKLELPTGCADLKSERKSSFSEQFLMQISLKSCSFVVPVEVVSADKCHSNLSTVLTQRCLTLS